MRLKGDQRHTRAVQRLMPEDVAEGRIVLTSCAIVIDDPAPLVLLEKALDAAHPTWRDDPMQFQAMFTASPRARRPPSPAWTPCSPSSTSASTCPTAGSWSA